MNKDIEIRLLGYYVSITSSFLGKGMGVLSLLEYYLEVDTLQSMKGGTLHFYSKFLITLSITLLYYYY